MMGENIKNHNKVAEAYESEHPKRNATIEKWMKYYQDKDADAARQGGVIFKELNLNALKAEMSFYGNIPCKTKLGEVSIKQLESLYAKAGQALLLTDCHDTGALKKQKKKINKIWKRILVHPIYPIYHACSETIRAVQSIDKLSDDVQSQIL